MKHIKLFEGYEFDEAAPFSITIELTDRFKELAAQEKTMDGRLDAYTTRSSTITLANNGDRYNMVKIATVPWDRTTGKQFDYWASYHPEDKTVMVQKSMASLTDLQRIKDAAYGDEIRSGQPILSETGETGHSLFFPAYHVEFENGFKVGEVDTSGYFRIVEVK